MHPNFTLGDRSWVVFNLWLILLIFFAITMSYLIIKLENNIDYLWHKELFII